MYENRSNWAWSQVKPGQDSIHELIIWRVKPFVASVTCSGIKLNSNDRWNFDCKWKILQWMKFLFRHFSNWQENWAGRDFITNSRVHCSLRKQKCRLKSTTTNGWRRFGQSEQRKSSVLYPIQSEKSPDSGFFACDLWKKCIMPSSRTQITEIKGEGMIAG